MKKKEQIKDNFIQWYDGNVCMKKKKFRFTMYNRDNSFFKNIFIPSDMYPLVSKNIKDIKILNYRNCKQVTDKRILEIFDTIEFKMGFCYSNTENLVCELKKHGFNAKSYVGWLLTGDTETPTHHCWCMIDDMLLDLSDVEFKFRMYLLEKKVNLENKNKQFYVEKFADFWSESMLNSERCFPVGLPCPRFLYIGVETTPSNGKNLYQELMEKYPNHETENNLGDDKFTDVQRHLYEKGYFKLN